MRQKYSIGLDIGTNSVGWAVIGEDDQLLRYKKKNMWGARLFDQANKAEDRRLQRSARRRLKRRRQRINFLQQIFAPIVLPVDDGFFIKLNESMLHLDDKTTSPLKLSLEKAGYYEKEDGALKYPTIYHLRKALTEADEKFDPRLVYLAIHHIIKYRGNFLYQGQTFAVEDTSDVADMLTRVFEYMEEHLGFSSEELEAKKEEIIELLKRNDLSRSSRRSRIESLFQFEKRQKDSFKQIISAIVGLKVEAQKIFLDIDKCSFDFPKLEEKRSEIESVLGENIELFDLLQGVYSWSVLQGVLRGESNISQAMINKYDAYAKDLQFIKSLFKKYLNSEYKSFFKSKKDDKQYIHYTKYSESGWNYEEFVKDLKSYIEKARSKGAQLDTPDAIRFMERLENGEAFSKQRMSDNGAIPYQLHKDELIKIIEKQGRFYPELLEKVDNGDGKEEYKLVRLIEYRIPYYVGPLQSVNQTNSKFAWAKRLEGGDITPFNFYKKVDRIGSAESFIHNLTNNCTYLPAEPVLPRHSLLFSEFTVRNEIKNMRVNGEQVSIDLENKLFNELFLVKTNVTAKNIEAYLQTHHFPPAKGGAKLEISGLAGTSFHSSMTSYIDFTTKVGIVDLQLDTTSELYDMVENIINWITIFEDKAILREKIKKAYDGMLTEMQIDTIVKLNYSGWASLSRKLLTEITDKPEGSDLGQSIIQLLRTTPHNFMQIISQDCIKAKLQAALDAYMSEGSLTIDNIISDLPASPAVKRGIRQAAKLVDEIIELQGEKPERIYIEMARGADGGGRKVNRRAEIKKLFDKVAINEAYLSKAEYKQLAGELAEANVDQDSIVLYLRQLGKCAYSGKPIAIEQVAQMCQIDHILPQSLIKDNSFDNRVLVLTKENQRKRESYPLDPELVQRQIGLWRYWLESKLMTPTKFARLTKTAEKYEAGRAGGGFIKRQLVETRQITKHVAALFDKLYKPEGEATIVEPVKAHITSEFRNKFNFPKSRSINDFHHAKDAYLAAVLGRYLMKEFSDRKRGVLYERYISFKKDITSDKNERQQREARELGFVLYNIDKDTVNTYTGEINEGKKRIATIDQTMRYNDCIVTKKTETYKNSTLFDATIYKHNNKAKAKIQRGKGLDLEKYGGHTSDKMAFMAAVAITDKKGKTKRLLVKIPVRIAISTNCKEAAVADWLKSVNNAQSVEIVKMIIPRYQVIRTVDGSMLSLVSEADAGNAKQLRLPFDIERRYVNLQKILGSGSIDEQSTIKRLYYTFPEYVERSGSEKEYEHTLKPDAKDEIHHFLGEFYDRILDKIATQITFYGDRMIGKVKNFASVFKESRDLAQKLAFLEQMLVLTKTNSSYPELEKLDISRQYFKSGTGKITSRTFYLDDITFYNYSITGLRAKKTKL